MTISHAVGTDYRDSLGKVLRSLPSAYEDLPIVDGARSALALVLAPTLKGHPDGPVSPANQALCPNCDRPVESVKSPYCEDRCREVAGFVRQVRSGIRKESLLAPDRQVALGQILWEILGGGLPLRNSLIDAKALARLMAKHDGRCAACGAPADTVDHIGSFCNRTSNLRPMCDACAQTKPFGSHEVLARPKVETLCAELARRVGNPSPIRACDDARTWDWRAYVRERKNITDLSPSNAG